MYALAILGGGVHGSMLFAALPRGVRERSIIIDTHKKPLQQFLKQCSSVGMRFLRSPASHCLSPLLNNLLSYAHDRHLSVTRDSPHFSGRYYTPHIDIFLEHSRFLLDGFNIMSHWKHDHVETLEWDAQRDAWKLFFCDSRPLFARRVILAIGMGVPLPPFSVLPPEAHVLHPRYTDFSMTKSDTPLVVIGGGMSGTQVALKYAATNKHRVCIISPRLHEIRHFDSNPCYIGPRCLPQFLKLTSYRSRADVLKKQRYPGSINPMIRKEYETAVANGTIIPYEARVTKICLQKQQYQLTLRTHNKNTMTLTTDKVLCATGWSDITRSRPHARLIDALAQHYALRRNENNGMPILSPELEWKPIRPHESAPRGLHCTGILAELELGPAAKNIIGAHLAFRRLSKIWHSW